MADPGDTDLALADLGKMRPNMVPRTLRKERRDEDLGEEIALVPVCFRAQPDSSGAFVFRAVLSRLADHIPPAFFRKRNRHGGASI